MNQATPIGVFDSGVGGLSVLKQIHRLLPAVRTVYVADQAMTPYGPRSHGFILSRARAMTEVLHEYGCSVIVVACNTATAAAIDALRSDYPELKFVGMEPAIKPAAEITTSNVVGVLATEGTLSAERYQSLAAAHSQGIRIVHRIGHGLAMAVEHGDGAVNTQRELGQHADAFISAGADVVVLGCTHYTFLADALQSCARGRFVVIDPAAAVATQAVRVVEEAGFKPLSGTNVYLSTNPDLRPGRMQELMGAEFDVDRLDLEEGVEKR